MKRQISGYIVYSGEIRKTIQNENPECSFGEISRIVGLKVTDAAPGLRLYVVECTFI